VGVVGVSEVAVVEAELKNRASRADDRSGYRASTVFAS